MVGGLLGVARLKNICSPENGIAHWPSFAETSVGSIVDNAMEDPNQSRCALGGIRTRTGAGLSRLPLPLGYEGLPVGVIRQRYLKLVEIVTAATDPRRSRQGCRSR